MKKNVIIALLILIILINGWAIVFLELPFYRVSLAAGAISLIFMTVIHERFVFLYAIIITLTYGIFLMIYAFVHRQSSDAQLLYIYNHLLLSILLLSYWILMNLIKRIGYENTALKQQVQLLQKYTGVTKLLTFTEFIEQAQWLLKSSERNKEEAWLVTISIQFPNKRTMKNMQEELEYIAMETIRQKFDLITSDTGVIYLLLKNTQVEGVQIVLERFMNKVRAELNFVDPPFTSTKEKIADMNQLARLVGEKP